MHANWIPYLILIVAAIFILVRVVTRRRR